MAPTDEEDRAHRDKLKREYTKRLRVLEIRQARQGDTADPATDNEIDDLRAKIADLTLVEAKPPAPEIKEAIRRRFDDDLDFLIASFRGINERLTRGEERDVEFEKRVEKVEQHQADDRADREQRQSEMDAWREQQNDELKAQSDVLTAIDQRSIVRQRVDWAIFFGVLFTIAILLYVFG
jgi:hypothetical protein